MPTVLVAAPVHRVLIEGLEALGYQCSLRPDITQAQAVELISECTGVITSTRLQLDKQLLDAAPHLQWIGRMGSGMEVIDLEHGATRGIICFSSPEGNCNAVGEHAVGMLLSLIRRIDWSMRELQQGIWKRDENRGTELEGKTVGIIGLGHTGKSFAKRLSGFDVNVLAYDKNNVTDVPPNVTLHQSLQRIYEIADIVSFHVPLLTDTKYYFNDEFISQMQRPFILINTSRGQVVDTAALYRGVTAGKVIGCCLDVFEQEPLLKMPPEMIEKIKNLMGMPNVVVTPHIAGYTHEALYKMSAALLQKVKNIS